MDVRSGERSHCYEFGTKTLQQCVLWQAQQQAYTAAKPIISCGENTPASLPFKVLLIKPTAVASLSVSLCLYLSGPVFGDRCTQSLGGVAAVEPSGHLP
jgi:hypothetical protein